MANDIHQTFDRIEALLEFPAEFPIKVIGQPGEDFHEAVSGVVLEHVPEFDTATITANQSSSGKYLSLTINVQVHSREQLQNLYMTLANHELVRMVI